MAAVQWPMAEETQPPQEPPFSLLDDEQFQKLTQEEKIAYLNRAIRILTFRDMTRDANRDVTVAIITPPRDDEKK